VRAELHGIGTLLHGLRERAVELLDATHERDGKRLDAESSRRLLHHLREQGPATEGRVLDRRHSTNGRDGGLQQIHPLRVQLSLYVRDAREISAGAREALPRPVPRGSLVMNTMGVSVVALLAARAAKPVSATITSSLRRVSSAASPGSASAPHIAHESST
jgi:hypothetical protein